MRRMHRVAVVCTRTRHGAFETNEVRASVYRYRQHEIRREEVKIKI